MQGFRDDLRLAARSLRRAPGATAVAVLTLALGLGATTAISSVVDAVLLRTVPFPEPERLVMLWGRDTESGEGRWSASYPDFADFRTTATAFAGLGAASLAPTALTGADGPPQRLHSYGVSHDLFPTLGVQFLAGGGFTAEDDRRGAAPVAILSEGLWRARYAADPAVVGRRIVLDGAPHTVRGVVAEASRFPEDAEAWVPLAPLDGTTVRGVHNLLVVGRLAEGIGVDAASAEVAAVAAGLAAEHPADNARRGAFVEPLRDAVVRSVERSLWVLLAAVGLVLLVACVDVGGLLLHRAAERSREVATRRALGASRGQLLRLFLAESAALVAVATLLAVGVAHLGVRALVALAPDTVPRLGAVTVDVRMLALTAAIAGLCTLAFGLAPLLETGRSDLQTALRQATGGALSSPRRRLRSGLVVAEVALALVLVTGAALLLRSFGRILAIHPGFAHAEVLSLRLELPTPFIDPDYPRTVELFARLVERIEALPGVAAAAAAFNDPVDPGWESSFRIEGRPEPAPGQAPEANLRPVTPGYFATVGLPLVEGRLLDARDHLNAPGAVLVNEAFARAHFPDGGAVGSRLRRDAWWGTNPEVSEIVGVVADVAFAGLGEPFEPAMYFPHAQQPMSSMALLVRPAAGDPYAVAEAVRQTIWELRPDLPIAATTTLADKLAGRTATARFLVTLFSAFGALALALAAVGLYGVLAYDVGRRRREIGLRMALGADPRQVVRSVVGDGFRLVAAGLVLGGLGALATTRFLESLLYETSPLDPLACAAVVALLAATALVACAIPSRRATRVDPVTALRAD